MRMAGPDIVLFVIGALLFGGATYAIVSQPGGGLGGTGSALGLFTVTFEEETVELQSELATSLRAASFDFEVEAMNVTSLEFVVACSGNTGDVGPVTFSLAVQVTGPNGLTGEGTGTCGQGVLVPIDVAALPESTSAQGADEAAARAALAPMPNATAAQGTWTIAITGSRAGTPSPLPVNPSDPGGTVTLNANQWVPRFAPLSR